MAENAEQAVEQLLWRMAHPDAPARAEIFVPPEVVEGEKFSGTEEIAEAVKTMREESAMAVSP